MYCPNCNFFNNDNSKFCNNCGARLTPMYEAEQQTPPMGAAQAENGAGSSDMPPQESNNYGAPNNSAPFNQPFYSSPLKKYTNTLPIIALIMSFATQNLIGIILGLIALLKYNDYEKLSMMGDIVNAEKNGKNSKNMSIAAIVLSVLCLILIPILIIAFCLFILMESDSLDSDFMYGAYNMICTLL